MYIIRKMSCTRWDLTPCVSEKCSTIEIYREAAPAYRVYKSQPNTHKHMYMYIPMYVRDQVKPGPF